MGLRINCLASNYSEIAMLHYWSAKHSLGALSRIEYECEESVTLSRAIKNDSIITVTFAAMALEAYFNDYAATRLGDKFYSEYLESLKPTGKLQIISRFIFGCEIDKSSNLYRLVNTLFKERNILVHNKSEDGTELGMPEEEHNWWEDFSKTDEGKAFFEQQEKTDMSNERETVLDALEALRAMKEVCVCFDKYDPSTNTCGCLLMSGGFLAATEEVISHLQEVQKELGVKAVS